MCVLHAEVYPYVYFYFLIRKFILILRPRSYATSGAPSCSDTLVAADASRPAACERLTRRHTFWLKLLAKHAALDAVLHLVALGLKILAELSSARRSVPASVAASLACTQEHHDSPPPGSHQCWPSATELAPGPPPPAAAYLPTTKGIELTRILAPRCARPCLTTTLPADPACHGRSA